MSFIGDFLNNVRKKDYEDEDYYEREDGSAVMEKDYDEYDYEPAPRNNGSKVLNLHEKHPTKMRLHKLKGQDYKKTAKAAANDFKNGCYVLINVEDANLDTVTRLIDFLAGVVYALEGKMARSSNNTYVVVPYDCEIGGEMSVEEDFQFRFEEVF